MEEYEIPQSNKGLKNILLLIVSVVLVAALVLVVYYFTKVNKPASSESLAVNFNISKGQRTRLIAEELEKQKVIGSTTIFLIYALLHSAGDKIQAGQYSLNANMTIPQIVGLLTNGKVVSTDHNITVVEGWTNKQIGTALVKLQIIPTSAEFEKLLKQTKFDFRFNDQGKQFAYQGFLFPDTYKLANDATADELVLKMLKNFESKITDQMLSDIQSGRRDLKQVMIMASIIEKEVGRNKQTLSDADLVAMQKERQMVASVFYNRLDVGMALESDATVNYITGKSDRSVSIADTKIKSSYNTYQVKGLPPAPISNPGLGSIKAAIYPSTSDYVYFLNKPNGEAVFSRTLDEHNANKARYLK